MRKKPHHEWRPHGGSSYLMVGWRRYATVGFSYSFDDDSERVWWADVCGDVASNFATRDEAMNYALSTCRIKYPEVFE